MHSWLVVGTVCANKNRRRQDNWLLSFLINFISRQYNSSGKLLVCRSHENEACSSRVYWSACVILCVRACGEFLFASVRLWCVNIDFVSISQIAGRGLVVGRDYVIGSCCVCGPFFVVSVRFIYVWFPWLTSQQNSTHDFISSLIPSGSHMRTRASRNAERAAECHVTGREIYY